MPRPSALAHTVAASPARRTNDADTAPCLDWRRSWSFSADMLASLDDAAAEDLAAELGLATPTTVVGDDAAELAALARAIADYDDSDDGAPVWAEPGDEITRAARIHAASRRAETEA